MKAGPPSQYVTSANWLTVDVGNTVMVKVRGVPMHPFAVGVTVMVAITGDVPVFEAVKDGMDPVPLPAKPIDGVLLVQTKVVPATGLPKVIA